MLMQLLLFKKSEHGEKFQYSFFETAAALVSPSYLLLCYEVEKTI